MTVNKVVKNAKTILPVKDNIVLDPIDGVRSFVVVMKTSEMMSIRRNKYQRDEEVRNLSHLEILVPEHLDVKIIQGFNGELAMLDGHSRRYKWGWNKAMAPEFVRVTVYDIVDASVSFDAEEQRLYESCDSRRAVKTSAHTIQGAMSSINLELETVWLKRGDFAEALKKASTVVPGAPSFQKHGIAKLISFFRADLKHIDALGLKKGMFVSPFLASALILVHQGLRNKPSDMSDIDRMLTEYNSGKSGWSEGCKFSPQFLLSMYRDEGLDGTGITGKRKGRFPTNGSDYQQAVSKIIPLMIQARDHEDEVFDRKSKRIAAMNAVDIRKLNLRASVTK